MNDTVTIPRELAEAVLEHLHDLRGEWHWRMDEPRCGYQKEYEQLGQNLEALRQALIPQKEKT